MGRPVFQTPSCRRHLPTTDRSRTPANGQRQKGLTSKGPLQKGKKQETGKIGIGGSTERSFRRHAKDNPFGGKSIPCSEGIFAISPRRNGTAEARRRKKKIARERAPFLCVSAPPRVQQHFPCCKGKKQGNGKNKSDEIAPSTASRSPSPARARGGSGGAQSHSHAIVHGDLPVGSRGHGQLRRRAV